MGTGVVAVTIHDNRTPVLFQCRAVLHMLIIRCSDADFISSRCRPGYTVAAYYFDVCRAALVYAFDGAILFYACCRRFGESPAMLIAILRSRAPLLSIVYATFVVFILFDAATR